ncbi:phosphotransferase [Rhizocola hellebori]|uniref:Phosphotransferase n=1 Tax=Rhizocola hellebori TaxID=1392758 RepID=A0A8J3QCB9_9ACTN|nr:aminoglycoside phosphotransferase family protein [Rhizocola hellebori]GIH06980.1 phosphotransferase [Rhizocola hellebori]
MTSPTQRQLTLAQVAAFAEEAFGLPVAQAAPLEGGTFAAVWKVGLVDGREAVLKVGPLPGVPILIYERDMIRSEAEYFRLVAAKAPEVPVPRVLFNGDDWLFTSMLAGTPLSKLPEPEHAGVREQLGAALARVHTITGTFFGYPGDRPNATDWPTAFAAMMEALLQDAVVWQVALPVSAQRIRDVVAAAAPALGEVRTPVLVHFDLWDGNVLAHEGKLTGLVDGERYLYGDPLIDFVSPAIFRNLEDEPDHPFLRGYGEVALYGLARQRLVLYRLYLDLLMHVEVPSRGITDPRRIGFVAEHLVRQVEALERLS